MSTSKKNTGEKMMVALTDAKEPLTTAELGELAGVSPKDAFSRLWWLQFKEGVLKSTGHGKERRWALTAAARRARAEQA